MAERLDFHFARTLDAWEEASQELSRAEAMDGRTTSGQREALVARAHVLSLRSVRNWCRAARWATNRKAPDLFDAVCREEIELTRQFRDLVRGHPWLWDNNCWHPHQTPLSQRGLGLGEKPFRDAFEAKLEVMKQHLPK